MLASQPEIALQGQLVGLAEFKAILGIPEDVDTFALMPIGWPKGHFGQVNRRPLREFAHADRWSEAWPGLMPM